MFGFLVKNPDFIEENRFLRLVIGELSLIDVIKF